MASGSSTAGQRVASRLAAWIKENDRSVAWVAKTANLKSRTLTAQIHAERFPLEVVCAVAPVMGMSLEELTAPLEEAAA